MAFGFFDRVKETSTTTGTGVIALAGAVTGFRAFSSVYANADTLHYTIFHPGSGDWEVGFGTWSTGNNLTRTTVLASSNAGAAVNFAAGTKEVFVTWPAGIPSSQGAVFFSTADAATRDAIPAATLRLGAMCRLLSTGLFYAWDGSAWVAFTGFSPTGSAAGQVQVWNGSAWTAGAVDLADLDAVTGKLAFSNIADLTGLSVLGRAPNTLGAMAAITAANDFEVLRRSGTTLSFGTLVTGSFGDNQVTLAKLATASANAVLGRSAATTGNYADIVATADGQVLRRAGGILGWGAVDLADADGVTGKLGLANFADLAGLSVLGRASNSTGVQAAITAASDGHVLRRSGTTLGFGQIDGGLAILPGTVAMGSLPNGTAASVLGRSAATSGAYADIVSTADGQVFRRVAGVLGWGAIDLADADAVSGLLAFANIASLTGLSVLGRASNTLGVMAAITGTNGQVLRVSGTTLGFGTIATAGYADASVTLAKLATTATAASLLGRSAATVGAYADIASSADGQVLRRTAGVLGFGAVDLADPDAVSGTLSFGSLPTIAGLSVLGRATNTTGAVAAVTGSAFSVLSILGDGSAMVWGTISTGNIGDAQVTLAKLDDGPAVSLVGRSAATSGPRGSIIASADGQVLRRGGGTLFFGAVDLADADAVMGQLPLSNFTAGTNGRVLVTAGGVPTWGFALGNNTDAFSYNGASHTFSVAGTSIFSIDSNSVDVRVATFQFLDTVANPSIGINPSTTAAPFTATGFTIYGQDAQGTGSTVGGLLRLRAGASTNGTGGDLDLRSGAGASSILAGDLIGRIGSTAVFFWSGTVPVASVGNLRLPNGVGSNGVQFRNAGNSADVIGLQVDDLNQILVGDTSGVSHILSPVSGGAHVLTIAGATVASFDADSLDFGVSVNRIRFNGSLASDANIDFGSVGTAAAVGKALILRAQGVTGTGATVGGIMRLDAGASTNGIGGVMDIRSGTGATASGNFALRVGATTFLFADGSLAYPTSGMLRSPHNSPIVTGRDTGGTNRNGVRFGQTANDVWTFGDSSNVSELFGSAVRVGLTTPMFEVAALATSREVISLLQGAALTTTQMPANTGDKVVYWADATAMPTTGFPAGGGILGVDTNLGLEWKGKNGVETTIAPHGDSGNTTKRRMIDWKSRPQRISIASAGLTDTAASFDVAALNGQAVTTGHFKARAHYIADAGGYASCGDVMAFIKVTAGVPTVGSIQDAAGAAVSNGGPFNATVIDASGTTIRFRVTTHPSVSGATEVFSYFEVMEFEP